MHRLPLEKGLSAIPRLNPPLNWKQNTNLTETHKRGTDLELWLEETKRAPLDLTFSTFYHEYVFCVLLNVLRSRVGAGKTIKQKRTASAPQLLQSSCIISRTDEVLPSFYMQ